MYTIKFEDYNSTMKDIVSEEETLQYIIDVWLNGKPSKEEKVHLSSPENWAKYAFAKDDIYYLIIYKEGKPFANVMFGFLDITVRFLDYYNGRIECYLLLVYYRLNALKYIDEEKIEYYENKNLFLGQINSYVYDTENKSTTEIVFNSNGTATITMTQATLSDNTDWNTMEKTIDINISHNFIRPPKDYKDFIYLLDYKNNIKPDYFDVIEPEEKTPPKPAPYKIHEGKEYTKEEWQQYQEEKRKNARPGTTWSLLED